MKTIVSEPEPIRILIEKAKSGDREAFRDLVHLHRRRLEGIILARIGKHLRTNLDPADVLQDTLLQAFRSIGRFEWRDEESFLRWLAGIAEHQILKAFDKLKQRPMMKLLREIPASEMSPSKGLRREERLRRLEKALEGLSPEYRQVILLTRIEGLQIKDAAQQMGRSIDAVKQLLSRALKKLKTAFGETESLHLPDRSIRKDDDDKRFEK